MDESGVVKMIVLTRRYPLVAWLVVCRVSVLIDVVRSVFSVVLVVDDVDIVCLMSHLYKYIDRNPYPSSIRPSHPPTRY